MLGLRRSRGCDRVLSTMKRQEPGLAVVVLKEKRIRLLDSEGKEEEVAPEEDAAWKRLAATGEQPKAEKDEDEMEEEKEAEGNVWMA